MCWKATAASATSAAAANTAAAEAAIITLTEIGHLAREIGLGEDRWMYMTYFGIASMFCC